MSVIQGVVSSKIYHPLHISIYTNDVVLVLVVLWRVGYSTHVEAILGSLKQLFTAVLVFMDERGPSVSSI